VSQSALLECICLNAASSAFSQQHAAQTTTTGTVSATASDATPLNPRRLSSDNAYARVYCVVRMVGSGTPTDPIRPMFAPVSVGPTASLDREALQIFSASRKDWCV
jgi:hypothetical protein